MMDSLMFAEEYKYILLFIVLFVGGDAYLVLALSLATVGFFSLGIVFWLAVAAALSSDAVWYFIGTYLSYERIKRWPFFRRRVEFLDRVERFYNKHALRTLFYSKFVYGSRTIVQILSGVHRVNFLKYFGINILGTFTLVMLIFALVMAVGESVEGVQGTVRKIEITFAAVVLIAFVINRLVRQRFLKEIEKEEKK